MACVPYASVVGSLMYVMACTLTNIAHEVGVLTRYMSTPRKEHSTTVKRVFKYFSGTKYYDICYQGLPGNGTNIDVHGFFDTD
jgi:hypothetical protein